MRKKKKGSSELSLVTPVDDLTNKLLTETDLDEFNKIKSLFDLNMKKKEILRVSKLNELQDLTVDEMSERLSKRSGEFSNQDLITYFKTIQETIGKTDTSLNNIDIATIKVVQNQLNIQVNDEDTLDRESKNRVIEAIRSILNNQNQQEPIEAEILECEDN